MAPHPLARESPVLIMSVAVERPRNQVPACRRWVLQFRSLSGLQYDGRQVRAVISLALATTGARAMCGSWSMR